MEADWYVDPLGRYEGRFFDGEAWTERVSDSGILAIDPLWPPAVGGVQAVGVEAVGVEAADASDNVRSLHPDETVEVADEATSADVAVLTSRTEGTDPGSGAELADRAASLEFADAVSFSAAAPVPTPSIDSGALVASSLDFGDSAEEQPAVQQLDSETGRKATLVSESPARTVAVVNESLKDAETRRRPRRWLRLLLPLLLLALVALAVYFLTRSSDTAEGPGVESTTQLDDAQEDRVEDLEAGVELGDIDPSDLESLDADDADLEPDDQALPPAEDVIDVGGLSIVNGNSVLFELEDWHRSFAASRDVELPADATCWFGRLGEAAVTTATCGPVGGSADTEFLYDIVPLRFLDIGGGQLAQPALDEVMIDEVISPTLELIGTSSDVVRQTLDDQNQTADAEPADGSSTEGGMRDLPTEEPQRGERVGN